MLGFLWKVVEWSFCLCLIDIVGLMICGPLVDDSHTSSQHSFLSRAALDGDVARVAELLEGGADPDGGLSAGPSGMFGSGSPLFYASENGHTTVVSSLLKKGADPGLGFMHGPFGVLLAVSPLYTAANKGHAGSVLALLEAGAAPDQGYRHGPFGCLKSLSPLYTAVNNRNYNNNGNGNGNGNTNKNDIKSVVDFLLHNAADPLVGSTIGPFGSLSYTSPLSNAASNGNTESVVALLKAGADPDTDRTIGTLIYTSPLYDAAKRGHVDTATALLQAGSDPNTGFRLGPLGLFGAMSPLYNTAGNGHADAVAALLAAGADATRGHSILIFIPMSPPSSSDEATQSMVENAQALHTSGHRTEL